MTSKPKTVSYSSSTTSNDNEKDSTSADNEEENKDNKPRYNEEKPSYSKEYKPRYNNDKPKGYGYRFYRQNYHPDDNSSGNGGSNYDNKKGNAMKLVGKSTSEEDTNQDTDSQLKPNESNNQEPNNQESNNQEEDHSSTGDKYSSEGRNNRGEVEDSGKDDENSKDESGKEENSNDTNESKEEQQNTKNDESNSNEEKVDEEFSGSKKRKKRSIANTHYFSSVLKDKRLKNRDSDDSFEDNEEDLIDLNRPRELYFKRKLQLARKKQQTPNELLLAEKRYSPIRSNSRRRKIVTFDEPASYVRRNLDSSESFLDEDSDFFRKNNIYKGRTKKPQILKTLKDEYDDEFKYLKNKRAKLERRKCSGSNGSLRLNRIYSKDDNYNSLRTHPMYKFYQLIR